MGVVIDYEDKISYTEVYDILMFLNDEEKNKIPNKLIDFFKNNKLENYITKVNPYIPLELQKVRKETKAIIACIYRKYLADEEEKEEFKKKDLKEIKEERKIIEEKTKVIFNKNEIIGQKNNIEINNNSNLPAVKISFWQKIKNIINKIFKWS